MAKVLTSEQKKKRKEIEDRIKSQSSLKSQELGGGNNTSKGTSQKTTTINKTSNNPSTLSGYNRFYNKKQETTIRKQSNTPAVTTAQKNAMANKKRTTQNATAIKNAEKTPYVISDKERQNVVGIHDASAIENQISAVQSNAEKAINDLASRPYQPAYQKLADDIIKNANNKIGELGKQLEDYTFNQYQVESDKWNKQIDSLKQQESRATDEVVKAKLRSKIASYTQARNEANLNNDFLKNKVQQEYELGKLSEGELTSAVETGKQTDTYINNREENIINLAGAVVGSPAFSSDEKQVQGASLFLDDESKNKYYAILATKGEENAKKYLKALYNYNLGDESAKAFSSFIDKQFGKTGSTALKSVQAFTAGFGNSVSGIKSTFERLGDAATGNDTVHVDAIANKFYQHNVTNGSVNKVVGDIVYNVGNMMPQIIVSIATSGAGAPAVVSTLASSATVAMSTFGSTYQQTRREGYDAEEATVYATLNAVSEAGLQAVLNGVGKVAGGIGTEQLAKNAQTAFRMVAKDNFANKILGQVIVKSINSAGEFSEEYLQQVLDPVFRNWALGEDNEIRPFSSESLYAGILGAITAGVMNAPQIVYDLNRQNKSGAKLSQDSQGALKFLYSILDTKEGLSEDTASYKMARQAVESGQISNVQLALLNEQFAQDAGIQSEIEGFAKGSIKWNEMSDVAKAYLVDPSHIDFVNNRYGLGLKNGMMPNDIKQQALIRQQQIIEETQRNIEENNDIVDAIDADYKAIVENARENSEKVESQGYSVVEDAEDLRQTYSDLERKTGKKIKFYKPISAEGTQQNGMIVGDTIYINQDIAGTEKGVAFAVTHEITHSVENSRYYLSIMDSAKAFYNESNKNWNTAVRRRINLYRRNGVELSFAEAEREVVADFIGENVFGTYEKVKAFINSNPTTSRNVFEWLTNKVNEIKENSKLTAEERIIKKAYDNFNKAINESNNTSNAYSIDYDTLNKTTKKQYDRGAWALINGIISKAESKDYYKKLGDIKNGEYYPQDNNGNYLIFVGENGINNKIIVSNGNYNNPEIIEIITINENDETKLSNIREEFYDDKRSVGQSWEIASKIYGNEYFIRNNNSDFETYGELKNNARKRSYVFENTENNTGEQNRRGNDTKGKFSITEEETSLDIPLNAEQRLGQLVEATGQKSVTNYAVNKDVAFPQQSEDGRYVSETGQKLYERGLVPPQSREEFLGKIAKGDFSHERFARDKKYADNLAKLEEKGLEWFESTIGMINDESVNPTAEEIIKASVLANEYGRLAQEAETEELRTQYAEKWMDLTASIASIGSETAQVLNAMRMLYKIGGADAQMLAIEKGLKRLNARLKKKFGNKHTDIEIDQNLAKNLKNAKTQEEIQEARNAIITDITSKVPSDIFDKLGEWRRLAMLFNPKTHIRNVVGNAVFLPARALKDLFKMGIEVGLQRKGVISQNDRTVTAVNRFSKTDKQYYEQAEKSFKENSRFMTENSKYGSASDMFRNRTIFKNKWLEKIRKLNYKLLEVEDAIFLKQAYTDAYAKAMKARGVTADSITTKDDLILSNIATEQALKATYRDANALAEALNRFKAKNKIAYVIGEGLMPFTKTPLNILRRGVDYSPIGLVKGLYQTLHSVKNGTVSVNTAIENLAFGLSGTSILALGMFLASQGLIKGKKDDDDSTEYAITIGDSSYTIDWALPVAIPLFIGVEAYNATQEDDWFKGFKNITDSITKISDPLINLSVLESINTALKNSTYDGNIVGNIAINLTTSYAGQFVPTLAGQIMNINDDFARATYIDPDSDIPKELQYFWGNIMKKVPFGRYTLNAKLDRWGNEVKADPIGERYVESLISPGYYSTEPEKTKLDAEIDRLYLRNNNNGVLPKAVGKSIKINGEDYNLSAKEYNEFFKLVGSKSKELAQSLIDTDWYKISGDTYRERAMEDIMNYAYNVALVEYSKKLGDKKQSLSGWQKEVFDKGLDVSKYVEYRADTKNVNKSSKINVMQTLGATNDEIKKIYQTDFENKDTKYENSIQYAVDNGVSVKTYINMKGEFYNINERYNNKTTEELGMSQTDAETTWILKNATQKELPVLYATEEETDSTDERKTIKYAMSQGVSATHFVERQLQKANEKSDYNGETSEDYIWEDGKVVIDETGKAVSGSAKHKALNNIMNSGYSEKEMAYFYNAEYSSDDTFAFAMQSGMKPQEYIKYVDQSIGLKADKDENGNSINGSLKAKIVTLINSLSLSRSSKMMLLAKKYKLSKEDYQEIINYIMSLKISSKEKLAIADRFGLKVEGNTIYPQKK